MINKKQVGKKMYRILLVSTYIELSDKAREISENYGIALDIFQGGILGDGIVHAHEKESDYDVIISQGGTAAALRKAVSIPVIDVEVNITDIIKAIFSVEEYNTKIYIVGHRNKGVKNLKYINKHLDIDIEILPYESKDELEQQLKGIDDKENVTILGMGSCLNKYIKNKNARTFVIGSTYEAIEEALITAKNIIDLKKKERNEAERLKAIVDYSDKGVIAIDNMNIITTFSRSAEKILKINQENVLNKVYDELEQKEPMATLYGGGLDVYGQLVTIGDLQLVVNRVGIVVDNEQTSLVITFEAVKQLQNLEREVRHKLLKKGLYAKYRFSNIKGSSLAIKDCIRKAKKYAETDSTILINGETGTGKELFSQSIHNYSSRNSEPFVAINCAALPEKILESELFGYEEGAFTGARKGGKLGLFELAHKGTIFLDEISEIPISLQGRLLRVLQEKEVFRLGGDQVINTDIRVITATNKRLYTLVKNGEFREDLYFRLNILNLNLPSLNQRREDIPLLLNSFLASKKSKYDCKVLRFENEANRIIEGYAWPGNIRELENFVEKAIVLSESEYISTELVEEIINEKNECFTSDESEDNNISIEVSTLKEMELQIIEKILKQTGNDKNILADILGISRTTLWKRIKELES